MRAGSLFLGTDGQLLRACVKAVGLEWDHLWTTNLMCYSMRKPSEDHLKMCWSRVQRELEVVRPKVIFTIGKEASEFITGQPFGTSRACAIWVPNLDAWVIPTHDPALALYLKAEDMVVDLLRDLRKAELYQWRTPKDFEVPEPEVIANGYRAQGLLAGLPDNKIVTLDVETYQDLGKLACLAISVEGMSAYVLTQKALEEMPSSSWLARLHNVRWGFHNGIFDTRMLYDDCGVRLTIVEDSLLQSFSLDNRSGGDGEDTGFTQGIHGLKRLSAEYEGAGTYNVNVRKTIEAGEWDKLYKYNAHDAVYTARLIDRFTVWQNTLDVREMYKHFMVRQSNALVDQQIRGTPIDVRTLAELAHLYGNEYLKRDDDLVQMAWDMGWDGAKDINSASPKQLAHFLYDIRGLTPGKNNANRVGRVIMDGGERSTSERALEDLSGDPFVDNLLELRHVNKMLNTYVIGVERNLDDKGRVHPSPKVHGTVGGRLSYTEPPVQTIPSDYGRTGGENFGRLRGLFAAHPNEGMISWAADYEQAELWTMYMYSKDEVMLQDLQSGDFHTAASESMFKTKRSLHTAMEWQQIRFTSKFVTFGVAFGRSAVSLSQNQLKGYTIRECQEFIDNWYKRYNVFHEWVQAQKKLIQEVGLQVTPTGRQFKYPIILKQDAFRKCINHPVQSLAHDHLIDSNIELHENGVKIWFDVHDALLGEIPIGKEREVGEYIVNVMQRPRFGNEIGIPVELKIGKSWRESEKVYAGGQWKI